MRREALIALAWTAWAAAGGPSSPTVLRVQVTLADGEAAPANVLVNVYDAHRALALGRTALVTLPGRLSIELPNVTQPIRVAVRGDLSRCARRARSPRCARTR